MRVVILLHLFLSFCSCRGNDTAITAKEIDQFISKYEDVKFDELEDISIAQRSKSWNEVVYVVERARGNLPVYFVTFDVQKNKISNINRSNLEKKKLQDYLTNDELAKAISVIRKYDFYFLARDSSGNVFLNPFYADEPAYLLRLNTFTGDSIVKEGYVYKLYKDRWYLNKTIWKN